MTSDENQSSQPLPPWTAGTEPAVAETTPVSPSQPIPPHHEPTLKELAEQLRSLLRGDEARRANRAADKKHRK